MNYKFPIIGIGASAGGLEPLELFFEYAKPTSNLCYIDNGIGIPAQHMDEIFKIFKTIGTNADSNGIGLSVCKKIVEHHGGKIWVESELGLGSTFIFQITPSP